MSYQANIGHNVSMTVQIALGMAEQQSQSLMVWL